MNYIINLIKKLILRIPIIGNIIKNSYKILTRLVWNIKICKLYKTKNGKFYLPVFAYKDMIANTIKNNRIYQSGILDVAKQYVE